MDGLYLETASGEQVTYIKFVTLLCMAGIIFEMIRGLRKLDTEGD